jgi:hypothetical protein
MFVYNNTFTTAIRPGTASNIHFRNNLVLAQDKADPAVGISTFTNNSSSVYNGFMAGSVAPGQLSWRSPPFDVAAAYDAKTLVERKHKTLADFSRETEQDRHSRMIDFTVFATLKPVDPAGSLTKVYPPDGLDFALAAGSPAIDAGTPLPNVTDAFGGKAPDLGAIEAGTSAPHYGPRP